MTRRTMAPSRSASWPESAFSSISFLSSASSSSPPGSAISSAWPSSTSSTVSLAASSVAAAVVAAVAAAPPTRTMSSVAPLPMPSTCQRSLRRSTNATSTRIHSRHTSSSGPSTPSSRRAPLRPLRNRSARMHSLRAPSVLPPPMPLRSPSDSHWLARTQ